MKFLSKLFGRGSEDEASTKVEEETTEAQDPFPSDLSLTSGDLPEEAEQLSEALLPVEPGVEQPSAEPTGLSEPTELSDPQALSEALKLEPQRVDLHGAVTAALDDPTDRVDFYQKLQQTHAEEPYYCLFLGRAHRSAGQLREAVSQYQQYLRSFTEAPVLEELAEVFEQLGETYMASSSRMIAHTLKEKV